MEIIAEHPYLLLNSLCCDDPHAKREEERPHIICAISVSAGMTISTMRNSLRLSAPDIHIYSRAELYSIITWVRDAGSGDHALRCRHGDEQMRARASKGICRRTQEDYFRLKPFCRGRFISITIVSCYCVREYAAHSLSRRRRNH
jgi:hypothetical protein